MSNLHMGCRSLLVRLCTQTPTMCVSSLGMGLQITIGGQMSQIPTATSTPMRGPPGASPATGPQKTSNGLRGLMATSPSTALQPAPVLQSTSADMTAGASLMSHAICQSTHIELTGAWLCSALELPATIFAFSGSNVGAKCMCAATPGHQGCGTADRTVMALYICIGPIGMNAVSLLCLHHPTPFQTSIYMSNTKVTKDTMTGSISG